MTNSTFSPPGISPFRSVNFTPICILLCFVNVLTACTYPVPRADRPRVDTILELSGKTLDSPEFQRILVSLSAADFVHTSDPSSHKNDDGATVLKRLLENPVNDVLCRRAVNPCDSRTKAWEGGGVPQLRCRLLDRRSNEEWTGTIIHEQAHAAGYLHKGNLPDGNQCTVPYIAGDLAVYIAAESPKKASLLKDICPELRDAIEAGM
mgnify:CR=1 FL=1